MNSTPETVDTPDRYRANCTLDEALRPWDHKTPLRVVEIDGNLFVVTNDIREKLKKAGVTAELLLKLSPEVRAHFFAQVAFPGYTWVDEDDDHDDNDQPDDPKLIEEGYTYLGQGCYVRHGYVEQASAEEHEERALMSKDDEAVLRWLEKTGRPIPPKMAARLGRKEAA